MAAIISGAVIEGVGLVGDLLGIDSAADAQAQASADAISFQRESRDIARTDLQPYNEAGQAVLPSLTALTTDPRAQADYLANNPFYDLMVNRQNQTILNNAAARGKVGSGGTAEALQNSALLIGNQLLNQNIAQQQNLATLGANAAAGQATVTQNTGTNLSNIALGQGNSAAAASIGQSNAITGAVGDIYDYSLRI